MKDDGFVFLLLFVWLLWLTWSDIRKHERIEHLEEEVSTLQRKAEALTRSNEDIYGCLRKYDEE